MKALGWEKGGTILTVRGIQNENHGCVQCENVLPQFYTLNIYPLIFHILLQTLRYVCSCLVYITGLKSKQSRGMPNQTDTFALRGHTDCVSNKSILYVLAAECVHTGQLLGNTVNIAKAVIFAI